MLPLFAPSASILTSLTRGVCPTVFSMVSYSTLTCPATFEVIDLGGVLTIVICDGRMLLLFAIPEMAPKRASGSPCENANVPPCEWMGDAEYVVSAMQSTKVHSISELENEY